MRRAQPEASIQKAVLAHLRTRAAPGTVYWHTPNGGYRGKREAAIFKSMGVRPGVSDIIAVRNGEIFALELKAPGGRPTEAQLLFQDELRLAGGHCLVAEGLDEAVKALEYWNLLKTVNRPA